MRLRSSPDGYAAAVLATDTVLGGRYRIGSVLGRGGVADVYRAEDLHRSEAVAVKVLRNATTPDLRRFELEARTLRRLDHPAIVRLCDEGEHDGVPYLVLDLVDGEPLSHLIERGALPEGEVAQMGAKLAGALAHAHELGIVHRDVKPGNVLIDRERSVHLTDFGIARLVDTSAITSITDKGFVIGTAAYLAPEQVRGESAGPEADVYSLGLVLLEALTGQRVFGGSPTESALARLQRRPDIPPLAPRLASLLAGMTALEPARRPRATAVADALTARDDTAGHTAVLPLMVDPTAAVAQPETVPPAAPRIGRRWPVFAALAALIAALAILLAVGGNESPPPPANADIPTTTAPPATAPMTTQPTTKPSRQEPQDEENDNRGKGGGGRGNGDEGEE